MEKIARIKQIKTTVLNWTKIRLHKCQIMIVKIRVCQGLTMCPHCLAVPPEKPRIFSDRGKEVRLKLGPYQIGEDVRLRCEAVGGRPLARVTWWRDHALLDDSFQVERDKVGRKFSSGLKVFPSIKLDFP